jgi:RHS repeat-associated protein
MPFGEDIFVGVGGRTAGQKYSSTTDDIQQKFTGYQKDNETNLDFAEARMYENRYGRFTAVDPLLASGKSANPQTFNRYGYVENSPLVITDPSGMIGDYFNRNGVWLGTDGKKDGKVYFATEIGRRGDDVDLDKRSIRKTTIEAVLRARDQAIQLTPGNEREAINFFATMGDQAASDTAIGTLKGIGNSPVHLWNGLSQPGGLLGGFLGIPNPFSVIPFFTPSNAREAVYENAGSTGTITGLSFAAGPFTASRALSVVPEEFVTFVPPIKPGSAGGKSAGGLFPDSIKTQAYAENPGNVCVYCRQANASQVDHAIPRVHGGNATLENAQLTCSFCNPSKGARPCPVNPAPGYEGTFPPSWWRKGSF